MTRCRPSTLTANAWCFILATLLFCSSASARVCSDLEGLWWLSSSTQNNWLTKEIISNQRCDHVTIITRKKEPNHPESKTVQKYDVHSDWQIKDRWQTQPDGGWRSLYGRVQWAEGQLTIHGRLIREEDQAVIWDIQHTMTRVADELYDRSLIEFPLRDKIKEIEFKYKKDPLSGGR